MNLPLGPSVNHYYGRYHTRTFVDTEGIIFRTTVLVAWRQQLTARPPWWASPNGVGYEGPLAIEIDIYPKDQRHMDLDNRIKPLLDALQYAKVFKNDHQIVSIHASRFALIKGGACIIRLSPAVVE